VRFTRHGAAGGNTGPEGQKDKDKMKKYQLYSEWRSVTRIGVDLKDALLRGKTLKTPAVYKQGMKVDDGKALAISEIHSVGDPDYKRGSDTVVSAIVEFADGTIKAVDCKEVSLYA